MFNQIIAHPDFIAIVTALFTAVIFVLAWCEIDRRRSDDNQN